MSATICAAVVACLVQPVKTWGGTKAKFMAEGRFAWLMSLLWQICGFSVAVVARAFRNGVAAGGLA